MRFRAAEWRCQAQKTAPELQLGPPAVEAKKPQAMRVPDFVGYAKFFPDTSDNLILPGSILSTDYYSLTFSSCRLPIAYRDGIKKLVILYMILLA